MSVRFNGLKEYLSRSKARRIKPLAEVKLLRPGQTQRITALDGHKYYYRENGALLSHDRGGASLDRKAKKRLKRMRRYDKTGRRVA